MKTPVMQCVFIYRYTHMQKSYCLCYEHQHCLGQFCRKFDRERNSNHVTGHIKQ